MRRMYSEKQILELVKKNPEAVVRALLGQDINVEGITSKGIANTGGLANIGDVTISGNLIVQGEGKGKITAKILEQTEANKIYLLSNPSLSGRTLTEIYNKAIVINNMLYIFANFKVTNETESDISSSSVSFDIEVDNEVGDKIYCLNGEKLSDDYTSNQPICPFYSSNTSGNTFDTFSSRAISKVAKNVMRIYLLIPAMTPNAERLVSGRQFLCLLP